ncbi:acyltransferase family protein [Streptomyces sp. NPDC021080]|uniref:acyltransferase family protein n=1 Tax=Streptomyces sp. NPDC021080 TaxID=3365110 RepID=UPI00378743D8
MRQACNRIYFLDGMRLAAAVFVMIYHYAGGGVPGAKTANQNFNHFAAYCWLGVQMFFMVSGFVICMSAWGKTLSTYLRSRMMRLYPAYWCCVFLTSVVMLIPGAAIDGARPNISQVLTNLTMLQKPLGVTPIDNSYWTLWSECRFYMLFALVAWLGLTYRNVIAFCWLWVICIVLTPGSGIPLLDTVFNPSYAPLFIAGIAFYVIRRGGARQPQAWVLISLSWFLMQHSMVHTVKSFSRPAHPLSWSVCVAVVSVFYLAMAAVALGYFDNLNWRVLSIGGSISYPLYLVHQEIGLVAIRHWQTSVPSRFLIPAVIATMIATGWAVHRFVERPTAALLKKFFTRNSGSHPPSEEFKARQAASS